jgi:hypothetical protein
MGINAKQKVFVEHYLRSWNATQAALAAEYSERSARAIGCELLTNLDIKAAVAQRLEELTMSPAEVLTRLTEHARANMGDFFKLIEEWTAFPLPSYEIIDAKEVEEPAEDGKPPQKHTVYWVRHVAIDVDKLLDPRYARLVDKFKDSPKDGLSLELHDAQGALKLLGQKHGLFKDKLEVDGAIVLDTSRFDAALAKVYGAPAEPVTPISGTEAIK